MWNKGISELRIHPELPILRNDPVHLVTKLVAAREFLVRGLLDITQLELDTANVPAQ